MPVEPVELVNRQRGETVVRVVIVGHAVLWVRAKPGEIEDEPVEPVRSAEAVGAADSEVGGRQLGERLDDRIPIVEELGRAVGAGGARRR